MVKNRLRILEKMLNLGKDFGHWDWIDATDYWTARHPHYDTRIRIFEFDRALKFEDNEVGEARVTEVCKKDGRELGSYAVVLKDPITGKKYFDDADAEVKFLIEGLEYDINHHVDERRFRCLWGWA